MDYAFAPGSTSYDRYMRKLFTYKDNTKNVSTSEIQEEIGDFLTGKTVEDFVYYLSTIQATQPDDFPPEKIYIASHANDTGWLEINLDSLQVYSHTEYETIESVDENGTIKLPLAVVKDGDLFVTSSIQIKGCNVGRAKPFLQKLKEAFRVVPFLQAPKLYHYLNWAYANSRGIFETMQYDFAIISKERIRPRADLIAAFQNANFAFVDGSPVPDDDWKKYIPSKYYKRKKQKFDLRVNLGQEVAGLTRINIGRQYRHSRFRGTVTVPDLTSRPDAANHESLLRDYLLDIPLNEDTHPFPFYKRIGYDTFDDMINGLSWSYTYVPKRDELRCQFTRYEYRVLLPIRETPDGPLIFNFHPKPGTAHAAVNNMLESDTRLFAIV